MDKKKSGGGLGLGSVSVVTIFSVLCLTVFAVLALTTARNGHDLAALSAQAVSEYYAADLRCSEITQTLLDTWNDSGTPGQVEQQAMELDAQCYWTEGGLEVRFSEAIGETQELSVFLSFGGAEGDMKIIQWLAQESGSWVADESLSLWAGE